MSSVGVEAGSRSSVAKAAMWALSQSVAARLLSFAVFAILGRLLDKQAFGLVALSVVIVEILSLVVTAGAPAFLVQRESLDETCRSTVFWSCMGVSLVLSGVIWLGAGQLAQLLGEEALEGVMRWLALLLPLTAASSPQQGLLTRSLNFRAMALRTTLAAAFGGLVGIELAVRGWGAYALVAQRLAIAGATVLALWNATGWRPHLRWSRDVYREQRAYCRGIVGAGLLRILNSRLDSLMMAGLLGVEALGVYAVARRILDTGTKALSKPVESVAVSVLARKQSSPEKLQDVYHRSLIGVTALAVAPFAALAALAPDVVVMLIGERWLPAAGPLAVLCGSGLFIAANYINGALLRAVGKPNVLPQIQLILMIPHVPLLYVFSSWGPTGMATALLCSQLLGHPASMLAIARATGLSMRPWISRAPRVLLGTMIMTAVILATRWLFGAAHPLVRVVVGAAAGFGTYGFCLFVLLREEVMDFGRTFLGWKRSQSSP